MILFPLQMQPRAGRLWTFKIAWGLLVPASSASEIAYMNRLACQHLQTCPGLAAVAAAGCRPIWPLQINTITCKVCWIHLISDSWTLLHSLGGLNDCLVDTTGASAHFSFLPISNFESIIQVSGAKLLFVYIIVTRQNFVYKVTQPRCSTAYASPRQPAKQQRNFCW